MNVHHLGHRLLLCTLTLGVALANSNAQTGMATPGQFDVSSGGAATYVIPIQVPPGAAGIEPKLALSYNSQVGNGLLGMGWSLSGLSTITRCPKTLAQDGVRGVVLNDVTTDRYCLDGQRLMAINNGSYGADKTEYRTERESFNQVKSYTDPANTDGPAYFIVKTKAGLTLEYGRTSDSRIEAQGVFGTLGTTVVRVWALNKVQDIKGNTLTLTYTEDTTNGDYYPQRIDYTANANANVSASNSVQFSYQSRTDTIPRYTGGAITKQTVKLTDIAMYSGGILVRDYQPQYETAPSTLRLRMTGLKECAGGACLPSHSFGWGGTAPNQFAQSGTWVANYGTQAGGWTDNNTYPRYVVDVNGDGLPDIVGFASSGVYVSLNTGTSFAAPALWLANYGTQAGGWSDNNTYPRYLADVNGDGLPDIVAFGIGGVYISLNTGTSFSAAAIWLMAYGTQQGWNDNSKYPRYLADMNGDGLPDVVGFASDGVYVSLNTGTSFAAPVLKINAYGTQSDYYQPGGWTDNNTYPRYVIDMTGDGLPDIVGFSSSGMWVTSNNGTAFANPVDWIANYGNLTGLTDNNTYPRYLVDVNGDGLPDVVRFVSDGVYVRLNTGRALATETRWVSAYGTQPDAYQAGGWTDNKTYPRYMVDVNGDGLPDIIGFASSGVYVSLNTGTSFAAPALWASNYGTQAGWTNTNVSPRFVTDVNGAGFAGIIGFSPSGVVVSSTSPTNKPDLLTSINTGLTTTTITYQPLTKHPMYTKDTGSKLPALDIQAPLYVVSSVVSNNGIGGTATTNYKYGGLKADLNGRGLLGFRWMEASQVDTGITIHTEYRQDWPYTGMPWMIQKNLLGAGSNGLLSQKLNSLACLTVINAANSTLDINSSSCTNYAPVPGKRYFPFAWYSTEHSWDLNGAELPSTITSYKPDIWGNANEVSFWRDDGYGKTVTNTYNNDTANWFIGQLTKTVVTATAP